jgi:hypothetical protein
MRKSLSCQGHGPDLKSRFLDSPHDRAINKKFISFRPSTLQDREGFSNVDAAIQLGRWDISKGISQNVYERFLFSRSFDSPPSLKAASPADFA